MSEPLDAECVDAVNSIEDSSGVRVVSQDLSQSIGQRALAFSNTSLACGHFQQLHQHGTITFLDLARL